jgi:hypothetical protein
MQPHPRVPSVPLLLTKNGLPPTAAESKLGLHVVTNGLDEDYTSKGMLSLRKLELKSHS